MKKELKDIKIGDIVYYNFNNENNYNHSYWHNFGIVIEINHNYITWQSVKTNNIWNSLTKELEFF